VLLPPSGKAPLEPKRARLGAELALKQCHRQYERLHFCYAPVSSEKYIGTVLLFGLA
jgi:hypothetical protein